MKYEENIRCIKSLSNQILESPDAILLKEMQQIDSSHGLAISVISNRGSRPFPMPSSTTEKIKYWSEVNVAHANKIMKPTDYITHLKTL